MAPLQASRFLIHTLGVMVLVQGFLLYSQLSILEDMVGRRHLASFLLHGSDSPPTIISRATPTAVADVPLPHKPHKHRKGARQHTASSHHAAANNTVPPAVSEDPTLVHNASFCNASVTLYTEESDARCLAFLTNPHNIASIAPMASIMALARTIKFKVKYKLGNIRAIAKVPQNNFPFEPYSEYLGFRIDRLLGMNKVPPTAWVQIPVAALKDSLSIITDTSFHEWVNRDVFDFPEVKHQLKDVNGVPHMAVSMQLWMSDVHPLQDSSWAIDKHWQPYFYPTTPLRTHEVLPHLSDLAVLDFVLSNPDRRLDKNTYVAGGCRRNCERRRGELPHVGAISLVPIDQGSSFYTNVPPENNPLSPHGNDFCRFRRTTVQHLKAMRSSGKGQNPLHNTLTNHLPKIIIHVVRPQRIQWAQERLDILVQHIEDCERRFGAEPVNVWP
eukprot:GGOE01042552.1.p1 GENE.GGOE01042552.1~~GGOE01042552.1.p1  ORF type:complete len:443 (+),score=127.19 GGOE01042552.1:74-1402(+)